MKREFYETELNKASWVVPKNYINLAPIGTGAYGLVCAATDISRSVDDTGAPMKVAIKKFSRPFQTPDHAKRTYRELKILRFMKHENIIELLDCFTPDDNPHKFNDVYFVAPLVGTDLSNILKTQKLSLEHIQFLVYQILRALKYIHSAGIIHRDLKPSNIAVNKESELKILDFGLAREVDEKMSGYVATRWWRAPEVILSWMKYDQKSDIWSVGCIMGECIRQEVLFPGDDHIDQLTKIMKVVGTPGEQFLRKIESEDARKYVRSMPQFNRVDFYRYFNGAPNKAIDFLDKVLQIDPALRPSAEEALKHPYMEKLYDPTDEPISPDRLSSLDMEITVSEWKEKIWEEIEDFQKCRAERMEC